MTPIFRGTMSELGVLQFFNPIHAAEYSNHLAKLAGKSVEVTVRPARSQRSLDQNAYWWAVPVRLMAEYMGEELTATHYALLGECFGYHYSERLGRLVPNKGSSSALTTEEFSRLIEWCPPWALEHHGVNIPLPNEVEVPVR